MSESQDAQLLLKKRARRRLVGAIAFAGLAAVILPMVMDEEPQRQVKDVQIRIPGQEQLPFKPGLTKPASVAVVPEKAAVAAAPAETPPPVALAKPEARPVEHAPEKPAEKKPEKPVEKAGGESANEAERAAAILGGKPAEPTPAKAGGQHVILIGAFSNQANVRLLQSKLGELGVKVYTERLDAPEGMKTRVRAGPFASREAAEKALERMKRIGVNGIISSRS